MKKQAGTPKLGGGKVKHVFFSGRFTPEEAERVRAAIAKVGSSRSDFIRNAILYSADMVNVPGT
jgi:hypothetical protein